MGLVLELRLENNLLAKIGEIFSFGTF